MAMKKLLLLLCVVLLGQAAQPQTLQSQKLDAYVDTLAQNNRLMGTLSFFREGEQIYTKSVGYADVDAKRAWGDATISCVGSISKSFTAALIFRAIDQGKLSLNEPLSTFFTFPCGDKITVAHLLAHRSGIGNYVSTDFASWCTTSKTRAEMLGIIEKCGFDFEPGAKFSYSNSNYALLSYILELLYKKPYSEILDHEIVKPLGLKNTRFGADYAHKGGCCESYVYLDKWRIEPRTNPSTLMGAGGVWSTPHDLNVFAHALFSGRIVSPESLRQMTAVTDNVGMGLMKLPFYERWGYGHSGGIDGFRAFFIYFPEQKISYAFASNGLNFVMNDITIAALSAAFDKPFDIPGFRAAKPSAEELDRYLGVYASPQLPIKLAVTKRGGVLVAQGTGQIPFDLESTGGDSFRFAQAGIIIEFKPQAGSLVLRQGGGAFVLNRE